MKKNNTKSKALRRKGKVVKKKINLKSLLEFFLMIPVVLFFTLYALPFTLHADAASGINKTINFQGKVVNKTSGTNISDSTYNFTFKLYDSSSGGNQLWTETQTGVTVSSGIFQVALGSVTPLSAVDFNQDNLWLDITFNGETFGSRIRMTSVPQAINSQYLDGVVATQSANAFTLTGGLSSLVTTTINGNITLGSIIQPTSNGALTIQSTGANGLTLDTGGSASLAIGTTASSIAFGATNNPTYAFNGTGAVTFQGTSFTLGNGSSATIQTTTNAGLTLLSSGTGNITLGQNSGTGNIVVTPNAGGQAALIVDDRGVGDLITASSSGATKFVIGSTGNIRAVAGAVIQPLTDSTTGLQIGASNSTALVNFDTSNSFIKLGTGTSVYAGGTCKGTGVNVACAPVHIITSTGNRDFIIENTGGSNVLTLTHSTGGIPYEWNFSVGANVAGDFALYDTNGNTAFDVAPVSNWIGIGKNLVSPKAPLHVEGVSGGNAALIINQISSSTNDIISASSSGTTKFGVASTGLVKILGGLASDVDTLSATGLTIGGSTQNGLTLGRSGAATTINGSGLTIGPTSWTATPTISGQITATLGVSVGAGQSYTGAGAVNVSSGGSGGLTLDTAGSAAISLGGTHATSMVIGRGSSETVTLNLGSDARGDLYFRSSSGPISNLAMGTTGQCLTATTNGDPSWGPCASAGAASDMLSNATYQGNSDVTFLSIPLSFVMSIATVSAAPTTSTADVYVRGVAALYSASNTDQTITLELRKTSCSGPLLATNSTTITLANGNFSQILELAGVDTNPGSGSFDYVFCESTTGAASQVGNRQIFAQVVDNSGPAGPQGAAGETLWQLPGLGVITPQNLTTDMLLGGTSTASAKFGVLNISAGTPTASISAGVNGALYLKANGTIQTTSMQSLVLGGGSSGDVILGDNSGLSTVRIQPNAGG